VKKKKMKKKRGYRRIALNSCDPDDTECDDFNEKKLK